MKITIKQITEELKSIKLNHITNESGLQGAKDKDLENIIMELESLVITEELKIQARLQEQQKNKQFKDAGETSTISKKYQRAYEFINLKDLSEIDKDEENAQKQVIKTKVLKVINPMAEKKRGVSAGAVFMKMELYKAFPAKPKYAQLSDYLSTSQIRARYVKYANYLQNVFDKVKTYHDFAKIEQVLRDENNERGNEVLYFSQADSDLGKRFTNLISPYYKSAASQNIKIKAQEYEGISKEESKVLKETDRIDALMKVEVYKASIEELQKRLAQKNHSNNEIKQYQKEIERKTKKMESLLERAKNVDNDLKTNPRPQNWSFLEKEKTLPKKPQKTSTLKIDDRIPLRYIIRENGLEIPEITPKAVIDLFGFKSVVFGNYVKDLEAREHLRYFMGAMSDFYEVLNLNAQYMNAKFPLSIGFGASGSGKALATYHTGKQYINLTKKRGDGSLGHELGHYLDNIMAQFEGLPKSFYASSHTHKLDLLYAPYHEWKYLVFRYQDPKYTYFTKANTKPKKVEYQVIKGNNFGTDILGDTLEESYALLEKSYPSYFNYQYQPGNHKKLFGYLAEKFGKESITVTLRELKGKNNYYTHSRKMGSKYWAEPAEMFARGWETYIWQKLAEKGMKNTYLQSDRIFDSLLYPQGKEQKQLFELYENIIREFKESYNIPNFEPHTDKRENVKIDLGKFTAQERKKIGRIEIAIKS